MKKTIAILLSVSCLFGLNSCFKTEEDIFDQSPAQRLNKLTSDYREVLSGSENGWVLQYFASETEQGYPFVMKFDKSGKVTIAGNNSVSTGGVYKEESSTYDFVQDMSVVLTFDTYNEIFHEFSSPQTDGVGHGGDYEFQMKGMSADKDTIYVMGKKSGIDMRLVHAATEEDFTTEYLDYKISVKTVHSVAEAIAHINRCSTGHSESIITEDAAHAEQFLNGIDSACVYWNASTRFTDGGCFGFGAEIGISTGKLHARGPMGLRELTTYKYKIYGDGQIR